MQIIQEPFLTLLGRRDTRFVIPMFQRVYSWNARQCDELWEDVIRAGKTDVNTPHFMGMLLYSADTESWHGIEQLDIIDGQQRMTTLSLLLCAFARYLDESEANADGVTTAGLYARFLRLEGEQAAAGKLVLSFRDRETLYALVGCGDMPEEPAERLKDNLELFYGHMREPGFDAGQLWRGLNRLQVASVLLTREDSPQLVFESLNSKGMSLCTADRIRNYIVVSDETDETGIFEHCWLPLEQLAVDAPDGLTLNAVIVTWMAARYRNVRIFDESEVYGLFKTCLREEHGGDLPSLLEDVKAHFQKLLENEELREEALADAQVWMKGKPKNLISEYKMFGD